MRRTFRPCATEFIELRTGRMSLPEPAEPSDLPQRPFPSPPGRRCQTCAGV